MSLMQRTTLTVIRSVAGDFTNDGFFVEGGAKTNFTIKATIQPANGKDMESLPEGRRTKSTYRLYTLVNKLNTTENLTDGDTVILPVDGETYEVVKVESWQNAIISHYKTLVQKINGTQVND